MNGAHTVHMNICLKRKIRTCKGAVGGAVDVANTPDGPCDCGHVHICVRGIRTCKGAVTVNSDTGADAAVDDADTPDGPCDCGHVHIYVYEHQN